MRLKIRTKSKTIETSASGDRKRTGGYWVAMSALMTYSASESVRPAMAQTVGDHSQEIGASTAQTLPLRRFDISAGPLDEVLSQFRGATGLHVRLASPELSNVQSPGVRGLFTEPQALSRIVANTRLEFRYVEGRVVEIRLRPQATTVDVKDQIAPLSSEKYTEPLRNTPQTINVIPRAVIEQQGATTFRDVLRNAPGIALTAGEGGGAPGDNVNVRGFSSRNDLFVDGVRDISPQSRDPFNMEQVEVVKRPNSAYMGRGLAGGTINMVSKQASLRPLFGGSLMLGTDDTRRVTSDVNTPVPFLGERTGFRMNALYRESEIAGRNVVNYQRWGIAPTLTLGLGTPTRFTVGYFKPEQDNLADYGIPWVPANNNALAEFRDRPAPVPRDTYCGYGLRNRDHEKSGSDAVTARVEHDFSDLVRFRNQFRYSVNTQDLIAAPPRFASPDSTTIRRELRAWLTDDEVFDNQTNVTAEFDTGPIRHAVVTGMSLTRSLWIPTGRWRRWRATTSPAGWPSGRISTT